MSEHRLIDRLTNYWNLLRKDEPVPEFVQFNISAIEDIWQQCVLFTVQPSVEGKAPNFSFYNIGEKVKSIYGGDMTGRHFAGGQRHFQGAAIVRKMGDIISNPSPVYDNGQFINEKSKVVKYRSCLLPFGRDGKVTHIVAGLSWREF